MSLTAFPLFPELVPELRNRIWQFAIASHIQDIADRLPRWYNSSWAERRRQAIVGGLLGKDRLPLYVHIRDPYNGLKLRFEEDEFESLVDCFPISAVCHETRINVAKFCQLLAPHMQFEYDTSTLWSLKPPEKGAEPVVLRSIHYLPSAETLEHVFAQPTTLTVNAAKFKSAEHLVEVVLRFFGNRIQRLVMNLRVSDNKPITYAYWSDPGTAPISIEAILNHNSKGDPAIIHVARDQEVDVSESFWQNLCGSEATLNHDSEGDPVIIYVTRDQKLHVPERFWQSKTQHITYMTIHLLKLYELFDASSEKLPLLEHIEVNLEVQGMDGTERTRLTTHWKRDSMVSWR